MEIIVNGTVIILILAIVYFSFNKFIKDTKNKKCSCGGSCSKAMQKKCNK